MGGAPTRLARPVPSIRRSVPTPVSCPTDPRKRHAAQPHHDRSNRELGFGSIECYHSEDDPVTRVITFLWSPSALIYRITLIPRLAPPRRQGGRAFTLIELLVVITIISLLISMLMPSLSHARAQAKQVHCLARLREFGTAIGAYENISHGSLPPARWYPDESDLDRDGHAGLPLDGGSGPDIVEYGWAEILFGYIYAQQVQLPDHYPVQRNIEPRRWENYMACEAAGDNEASSGHYRVYLPAWSAGTYILEAGGVYGDSTRANPDRPAHRERIPLKLPLIGDANEQSERGDGVCFGDGRFHDDCSYIDAGEANYAGSDGRSNGNRFSDRHYGGTNYLFPDLHATWDRQLREELARDYDLNNVIDPELEP